jgi:hypothetical protein
MSKQKIEVTPDSIKNVFNSIIAVADTELYAKKESELEQNWFWRWDQTRGVEWNTYSFSDMLEMYKRTCERWEEKHNGSCCVVERVRDKYVMPKVREFLAELAKHNK